MKAFAVRIAAPGAYVVVFLLLPLAVFFAYSFGHSTYLSLSFGTTLDNYRQIANSSLELHLILRSVGIGLLVGALCVLLAYPLAYSITLGVVSRWGDLVLVLILMSLFSAYIVRVYAWRTLLGTNGAVNSGLESLDIIHSPLRFLLYSRFAVVITLVNVLLPLAVLPLYASLSGVSGDLIEASANLGARPAKTFWNVTLPLSMRGVLAAFAFCSIVAGGDYVTPQLVGGTDSEMVGNLIQSDFGVAFNWPLGSAMAFVFVACLGLGIALVVVASRLLGLKDRPT